MKREDKEITHKSLRTMPFKVLGIAVIALVAAAFSVYRGTSFMPTSLNDNRNNAYEFVCTSDKIYHIENGEQREMTVKAIAVEADDVQYFGDWDKVLETVASAGANTVQAQDVLPAGFYAALHYWNENSTHETLYLIQRIRLGNEAYEQIIDMVNDDVADSLLEQGKYALDAVHGCRVFQGYFSDVSPYVVGYCVGDDWDPGLLAYTQGVHAGEPYEYIGFYYTCTSSFVALEARIAQSMDTLFAYEIGKYNHRTPLGVWNWTKTDEITHSPAYLHDSGGISVFMQSCISTTDDCQVGTFACYNLADESMTMIATDEKYISQVEGGKASSIYEAYVADTVLNARGPVIVMSKASSARGVLGTNEGYETYFGASDEAGQGKRYQELMYAAKLGGASGFCLPFMDNTMAISWNTSATSDNNNLWRNPQNPEQYCGIVAIDEGSNYVVDGNNGEWTNVSAASSSSGINLKVAYDSEYVYLCIDAQDSTLNTNDIAIAFDVTPESGSTNYEGKLTFDRAADFVLDLSSDPHELLVQRYNNYFWAVQTLTHSEMTQPARDTNIFGTIYQDGRKADYGTNGQTITVLSEAYYPTGGLVSGRDFAVGMSCIEFRIPWSLLNFFDPSSSTILGDYYQNTTSDQRLLSIDSMYVALCLNSSDEVAKMGRVDLPGWSSVNWKAREKVSFSKVRELYNQL